MLAKNSFFLCSGFRKQLFHKGLHWNEKLKMSEEVAAIAMEYKTEIAVGKAEKI